MSFLPSLGLPPHPSKDLGSHCHSMTRLSLIVLAALLGLSVAIPNESNLRVSNDHGGSWTGILRNDVIGFYGIKYVTLVRGRV